MNEKKLAISVIFPTLNEGENLKFLIPDFISEFNNLGIQDYELIVVDDGSSDGTENILFQINDQRINLIKRTKNPSLPLSIWEGIESANMKYVMWLDADGSMSAKHSVELIKKQMNKLDPCLNPDGRDRYVNFYKQSRSFPNDTKSFSREHHEPWQNGRTNHYIFDLNRDWAWLTQIESQQRIKMYNKWLPHVHVDFHEQSINNPSHVSTQLYTHQYVTKIWVNRRWPFRWHVFWPWGYASG